MTALTRGPLRWAVAALLVLVAGGAFWWMVVRPEQRTLTYVVSRGTVERLARGEPVSILPDTILIDLDRQDTLVIRNDDTQEVQIGPFLIAPGQRYRQRFYSPGSYDLQCSVHRGGQLRIEVTW